MRVATPAAAAAKEPLVAQAATTDGRMSDVVSRRPLARPQASPPLTMAAPAALSPELQAVVQDAVQAALAPMQQQQQQFQQQLLLQMQQLQQQLQQQQRVATLRWNATCDEGYLLKYAPVPNSEGQLPPAALPAVTSLCALKALTAGELAQYCEHYGLPVPPLEKGMDARRRVLSKAMNLTALDGWFTDYVYEEGEEEEEEGEEQK